MPPARPYRPFVVFNIGAAGGVIQFAITITLLVFDIVRPEYEPGIGWSGVIRRLRLKPDGQRANKIKGLSR